MEHPDLSQHFPGESQSSGFPSYRFAGRVLVEKLAWTAGLVGGFIALAAVSATPSLHGWRRRLNAWRNDSHSGLLPVSHPFNDWQKRILGNTKQQVATALGAPLAASVVGAFSAVTPSAPSSPTGLLTYWDANTWYYPFNPLQRSAIAIEFRRNRVKRVDFISKLV